MRGRPSAPLARMEALVLSKVDGRSSTGELALQVDLRAPELDAILARLVELGAIELLTSDAAAKASVGADGFRSLDDGWDDPAAGTQGADIFNQTTSPDLRAQDED